MIVQCITCVVFGKSTPNNLFKRTASQRGLIQALCLKEVLVA